MAIAHNLAESNRNSRQPQVETGTDPILLSKLPKMLMSIKKSSSGCQAAHTVKYFYLVKHTFVIYAIPLTGKLREPKTPKFPRNHKFKTYLKLWAALREVVRSDRM